MRAGREIATADPFRIIFPIMAMGALSNHGKLSGIAGLLFVLLSLVASALNASPPSFDRDGAAISAWFAANGQRYRIGHFVAGLVFLLCYFPFFAGLCERLREAEGTPALGSRVAWAGALLSPAAGTTGGAVLVAAAFLGGRLSPDAAAFAMAANFYALAVSCALGGVTLLGASWAILRTGAFRPWLGWTGLGIGLASVAGIGTVIEGDPQGIFAAVTGLAWLGQFLWMAAAAIAMLRPPGSEAIRVPFRRNSPESAAPFRTPDGYDM